MVDSSIIPAVVAVQRSGTVIAGVPPGVIISSGLRSGWAKSYQFLIYYIQEKKTSQILNIRKIPAVSGGGEESEVLPFLADTSSASMADLFGIIKL